jgi:plastocyanin domain-containing protein
MSMSGRNLIAIAVAGACFLASGCKSNDANATVSTNASLAANPGPTIVAVTVDEKGFTPSSASFKKGDHAQLVFTRKSDATCATEVVFPELKVTKPLPLNQAVTVDVPTADARTLTFQCGMGMFKSKVVIN